MSPGGGVVVQGRAGQRHQVHGGGEAGGGGGGAQGAVATPSAHRAQAHVGEVGGRQLEQAAVRGRAVVLQRRLGI